MPTAVDNRSMAEKLAALPEEERKAVLGDLSDDEHAALEYDWGFWGRPKQQPPTDDAWSSWLLLAGRGFGKTRTGAEFIREEVDAGRMSRIALVGPTAADARDVMVEGESGLLAVCPPWNRPTYEPSKRRVTWPNGALATLYSAEEPERLRGPQHDGYWADEFAAWRYGTETWDMLQLGLRLGDNPRGVVTTTPKRAPWLIKLMEQDTTRVVTGSTYENLANLAPAFRKAIIALYEGTTLGRQELHAELLLDVEGALWTRATLDATRVSPSLDVDGMLDLPPLRSLVVAVDPPATSYRAEAGIVVAGRALNGHCYVLADLSMHGTPATWGQAAVDAYVAWGADSLVVEDNQGGDMAEFVVRQAADSIGEAVSIARRNARLDKKRRAQPVAGLYEQGKVHHVGEFPILESQLTTHTFEPGEPSPDRLDALVWAIHVLAVGNRPVRIIA